MTTEEKAVIDAANELYRTRGNNPFFHIILGSLDGATGKLLAAREAAKTPRVEPYGDDYAVMLGDDIIAGPIREKSEADEYLAAMKRGDC